MSASNDSDANAPLARIVRPQCTDGASQGDVMNNFRVANDDWFYQGGYEVSLVRTSAERSEVEDLLKRMYARRDYRFDANVTFPPATRQSIFRVCRSGVTIATLTVRVDSEAGLLADGLYREELDDFRRRGGRICELTALAIAPGEDTQTVLNAMFRAAYLFAREQARASDVVIEVNPRHVAHYQRLLGFRRAGPERTCDRVGAPAILLHLDPRAIKPRIAHSGPTAQPQAVAGGDRGDTAAHGRYNTFIRFAASVNSARKFG